MGSSGFLQETGEVEELRRIAADINGPLDLESGSLQPIPSALNPFVKVIQDRLPIRFEPSTLQSSDDCRD